jgi:hypothetical protein
MIHPYTISLAPPLITLIFVYLDVLASPIFGRIVHTNFSLDLFVVLFLAIIIFTKVTNVLISLPIVFISHVVLYSMRMSFHLQPFTPLLAPSTHLKFFFFLSHHHLWNQQNQPWLIILLMHTYLFQICYLTHLFRRRGSRVPNLYRYWVQTQRKITHQDMWSLIQLLVRHGLRQHHRLWGCHVQRPNQLLQQLGHML